MKSTLVAFLVFLNLVIVRIEAAKKQTKRYGIYEDSPLVEVTHIKETEHYDIQGERKGYSIGSGLRSIAQGSADQANTAVANQHAAAIQAAFVAKSTLAQSAIQAASTALAALAGKEVLLHSLEYQRDEASKSLENELQYLQLTKKANLAAKQTSQQAQNQATSIATVLNNAQTLIEISENSIRESSASLAKQSEMVGKAKVRLENIESKLRAVKIDFEATKEAAEKAAQSANEAQVNANNAAHQATVTSHSNSDNNGYSSNIGYVVNDEGFPGNENIYNNFQQ